MGSFFSRLSKDYCVMMCKASDISLGKVALVKRLIQKNHYTQHEITKKAKFSQSSVNFTIILIIFTPLYIQVKYPVILTSGSFFTAFSKMDLKIRASSRNFFRSGSVKIKKIGSVPVFVPKKNNGFRFSSGFCS